MLSRAREPSFQRTAKNPDRRGRDGERRGHAEQHVGAELRALAVTLPRIAVRALHPGAAAPHNRESNESCFESASSPLTSVTPAEAQR